ncbi:hypothetical protein SAMN05216480_11556 [Pustulibacterium marinum]|uniref:40-residue YVTN family beta-propeller repeat-containing protein n=1 Tax=Pustulibacterium marinum TaxID=1224947 RepID=A0A1I7IE56_9FLAO|nr:hypothetical protein [Pustulibacterium marinum]SFU71178.1 hypothetical protein SAMN05216480_11556 [Pustulibacterium marinum]
MKYFFKSCLALLATACMFTSCDDNDDDDVIVEPTGEYADGYFILNENGGLGASIATFVGDDGVVTADPIGTVNTDFDVTTTGTYLQDMFFDDSRAFVISGSGNLVLVFDRYTMEYITTVDTDFASPRYGTVVGDYAYVTNYNDYSVGEDDFVTIINLNDYTTTTLDVNNNAEKIMSEDGLVYIANGYYGSGNAVTILDPSTNGLTSIDLGTGNTPNSFEEEDGYLYVLTYNYTNAALFTIDLAANQVVAQTDFPAAIGEASNLEIEDDVVYFTVSNAVYSMPLNATEVPTEPIFSYESDSAWGVMYGFAVEDNTIYIADGGDFSSNSTAYEYSLDGQLLNTITTGVGPNSFHFND